MALTARRIEPWELDDIDCTEAYRTVEDVVLDSTGTPVLIEVDDGTGTMVEIQKKATRYERRKHYVMKLQRKVVGISRFVEDTGNTRSSFSMLTGPDTAISYISSGRKWRCTRDALPIDRMEVGSAVNEQTWEHYSKWEQVDPNDFGSDE